MSLAPRARRRREMAGLPSPLSGWKATRGISLSAGGSCRPAIFVSVALAYLGFVLLATLGPAPWAAARVTEVPLGVLSLESWFSWQTWTSGSTVEFAVNIALFVPVGIAASRLPGALAPLLSPVVLTIAIEIVQVLLPERASDPRDILANSLGALIGVLLARRVLHPRL